MCLRVAWPPASGSGADCGKGGMQAASRMQAKCRHGAGKRLADGYAERAMCKTPQGQIGVGEGR